jgi:hypothetical protein
MAGIIIHMDTSPTRCILLAQSHLAPYMTLIVLHQDQPTFRWIHHHHGMFMQIGLSWQGTHTRSVSHAQMELK